MASSPDSSTNLAGTCSSSDTGAALANMVHNLDGPLAAAASQDAYTPSSVNQHAALKGHDRYHRMLRLHRKAAESRDRTQDSVPCMRSIRTTAFLERVHALRPRLQQAASRCARVISAAYEVPGQKCACASFTG